MLAALSTVTMTNLWWKDSKYDLISGSECTGAVFSGLSFCLKDSLLCSVLIIILFFQLLSAAALCFVFLVRFSIHKLIACLIYLIAFEKLVWGSL